MKKLYLVRHAKSSWNNPEHTDFERPLNPRGERDVEFMSNLLSGKIEKPNLFISSPAERAKTTAITFAKSFGQDETEIKYDYGIYEKGSKFILNLLKESSDTLNSIIIFGHNPDITSLSSYFSGKYFDNVPTCGIVSIEFDVSHWKEIENTDGKLIFFEFPKKYFS